MSTAPLLGGKFRLGRELGRGAMGIVYEAVDVRLDRSVAIKVMSAELLSDEAQRQRFEREARVAAMLKSEHAVRIHEVGSDARGAPYLVMERLEGASLESHIEAGGPISVPIVIGWMLEALDAIAEAHTNGLVHRDIKPANLFLADRPGGASIVKVLDFGLARSVVTDAQSLLTTAGVIIGTPAYMAPEQLRAEPDIDARADVFAIGVTLFELLTRELPFRGDSLPEMIHASLSGEAKPLRDLRADAPAVVADIVARCLMKRREDRFPDAAALRRALDEVARAIGATVALPPAAPATAPQPVAPANPAASAPTAGVSNLRVFLVTVLAVLTAGFATIAWFVRVGPERGAAPTKPSATTAPTPSIAADASVEEEDASSTLPNAGTSAPRLERHEHVLVTTYGLKSDSGEWVARFRTAAERCGKPLPPCTGIALYPNGGGGWYTIERVLASRVHPSAPRVHRCESATVARNCLLRLAGEMPPPTICRDPTDRTGDPCSAKVAVDFE